MRSPDDLALIAAIADDLAAGIWVAAAPDGRFVYANRAFAEIMGKAAMSDVGVGEYAEPYGIYTTDGELYPESRMPFVRALEARATVVVDDIVIHRGDGRRVYVRASAKPMFDANGAITHVAIAFFDITSEAHAEQAHARVEMQLAQAERLASVGMLAAGVAHEINNPLAYVVGCLDLLAREVAAALDASPSDALRAIDSLARDASQGAERVRSITRDLKMFARPDNHASHAIDVRSSLAVSIDIAMNEVRHRARLVRDLQEVPRVWADEGRLSQLFVNLIVNAAQAIPEGAAERNEIRIATSTDDRGWVCITVSDTGAGIAKDALAKIFDPFFTTKADAGTGLGLSICHAIVSELAGRITVESEVGRGSTFHVELPPVAHRESPLPEAPAPNSASVRRGSVLVIDDEPLILKVVASLLAPAHDVTCETRAGDALERIRRGERFDAILCDLMMPDMTGIDVYDTLLEIAPEQVPSVLFVTGGAFTARTRAFLERIPNATLEKPFDAALLESRVRQLVG